MRSAIAILVLAVLTPGLASSSGTSIDAIDNSGLAYHPMSPCTLVRTVASADGALVANETRDFLARGALDLRPQGGAIGGCGIPHDARVLLATLRLTGSEAKGQLKLWAGNQSEPLSSQADFVAKAPLSVPVVIELCVDTRMRQRLPGEELGQWRAVAAGRDRLFRRRSGRASWTSRTGGSRGSTRADGT